MTTETTTRYPQKVFNSHGVVSLWRYYEPLNCYVIVWPSEEPNLYSILRRRAFIPERQGTESGPYLYTGRAA